MNIRDIPSAFHPYRDHGVQHLKGFLSEGLRDDLRARAREIMRLRDEGALTIDNQDSQGLENAWFEPVLKHPEMLALATSLLGPDVVASGWRILVKDHRFKKAVHVHQDWPYNFGGVDKITVFVPLTQVNAANGGLIFYEDSHHYGPVSRGSIDVSRFPPMTEVCPEAEVGDLILCDYLTWHYSNTSSNGEERIMLQLNYQPASDPSSKNIVAGSFPHDKLLLDRWDAVGVPSSELNLPDARRALEGGRVDRAKRFAKGLVFDDENHAGASLLLYDILLAEKDPAALQHLEGARAALKRLQRELATRDAAFRGGSVEAAKTEDDTPLEDGANSPWKPLQPKFRSFVPAYESSETLPTTLGTPERAWDYGALSDVLTTDKAATIRIRAKAIGGDVGVCLVTENCSGMASAPHVVKAEDGDTRHHDRFLAGELPSPGGRAQPRRGGLDQRPGAEERGRVRLRLSVALGAAISR